MGAMGSIFGVKYSPENALILVLLGAADVAVLFAPRVCRGAMFELTPQVYYRTFSIGFYLMFFSWLDCCYGVFDGGRGKSQRLSATFTTSYLGHMIHKYWCWPWSPSWSTVYQVNSTVKLVNPFPYCTLWKEVTMCGPQLRSMELCSTNFSVEYYIIYFEIILHRRSVLCASFIQSFICINVNSWICIFLCFGQ